MQQANSSNHYKEDAANIKQSALNKWTMQQLNEIVDFYLKTDTNFALMITFAWLFIKE